MTVKKYGRGFSLVLIICMMTMAVPCDMITAYAASRKAISKITINLKLDLTAGDTLPDLSAGPDSAFNVWGGNDRYSVSDAQWVSSTKNEAKIGSTYSLKVTLEAEDSDEYGFQGTYKSSNVTVKGGSFVSASRKNYDTLVVTIKTKPVEGEYEAPEDAYWKERQLGMAEWEKVDNVSTYEVTLYKGSSSIYKVKAFKGTKINFYPYMTSAGTYSFKVRSVPSSTDMKDYADSSDWTESDEVYVAKESVSDGSGKIDYNSTNNSGTPGTGSGNVNAPNAQMGWVQSGNQWSYHYPDGSYQKNSWLLVNNTWYLFDADGWMLTGWQQKDGYWYYLDTSGAMRTGWLKAANGWYFLNLGPVAGPMWRNQWLDWNGKKYFLSDSGVMCEGWVELGGNWHYFYPGEGSMAVNTMIGSFAVDANGVWRK